MRRAIAIAVGVAAGVALGLAIPVFASRNSAGTYSLPGDPFVAGTSISSAAMNAKFSDVATELTNSLDRNGRGGMQAPLRTPDGSVSAPAHSFNLQTNSGLYRAGTSDFRMSVNGVDAQAWTASGTTFSVPVTLPAGTVTKAQQAAVGQQLSASSGPNDVFGTTTPTDVTNLSVTITTSGRPVVIELVPDGSTTTSALLFVSSNFAQSPWVRADFYVCRGATIVGRTVLAVGPTDGVYTLYAPPGALRVIDVPAAGTYTYKVQVAPFAASIHAGAVYSKLLAYEL